MDTVQRMEKERVKQIKGLLRKGQLNNGEEGPPPPYGENTKGDTVTHLGWFIVPNRWGKLPFRVLER